MADATKVYTALRRVRHDGTTYAIGEQIKLTSAQATRLLENGAITADKAAAKTEE